MNVDPHGFEVTIEVAHNEAEDHWYLVEKRMKGSILHRNILAMTYDTHEEANKAVTGYARPSEQARVCKLHNRPSYQHHD